MKRQALHAEPNVRRITPKLGAAFAYLVDRPGEWVSQADVTAASGLSRSSVYRMFGLLAEGALLSQQRIHDHAHYRIKAGWQGSRIAREMYRLGTGQAKGGR